MIMHPRQAKSLLQQAVVLALVTPEDHRLLGGIYTHHRDLYERMLSCPMGELVPLGWKRYQRSKLRRVRLTLMIP